MTTWIWELEFELDEGLPLPPAPLLDAPVPPFPGAVPLLEELLLDPGLVPVPARLVPFEPPLPSCWPMVRFTVVTVPSTVEVMVAPARLAWAEARLV